MSASSDEELIRLRAYSIWIEEGEPEGRESEHWRRARLEMTRKSSGPELELDEHRRPQDIGYERGEGEMNKREAIDTGTDKRYVRRDDQGKFKESDDVGKSLAQDQRRDAKATSKPGQGDKGDR